MIKKSANVAIFTSSSSHQHQQYTDMEQFVDRLISEKHGSSQSVRDHTKHRQSVLNRLHETLHVKLHEKLSPRHQQQVAELLKKETPHRDIQRYILDNVPEPLAYLTHVLLHFRISYLAGSQPKPKSVST